MAKKSASFACSECGAQYSAWSGRCAQCQSWNTIVEQLVDATAEKRLGRSIAYASIKDVAATPVARILSGDTQLDAVLGGGFVPGGVILFAGQPGIGKSTLLLQIAQAVAARKRVLYISGEESAQQVAARAARLGTVSDTLQLASSVSTDDILKTLTESDFDVVIIDSIQTITCDDVTSTAGSVSQITNSAHRLSHLAKQKDICLVVVGHVTKEGSIAGPKVLEHSVDTVLQLEGERYGGFKVLRSVKNRYGPTDESAIYEMKQSGLHAVENPSAALLEERQVTDGSIVMATMEGTRPLLVEIQALVNKTNFGYPKRAASGFDVSRLHVLIAVLEKRTKLVLSDMDIYINVVGGITVNEPAADLAICMAIASAAKGMQLSVPDAVVFGELGLAGEIRHVPHADKRAAEALKLGFKNVIGPKARTKQVKGSIQAVTDIKSALTTYLTFK